MRNSFTSPKAPSNNPAHPRLSIFKNIPSILLGPVTLVIVFLILSFLSFRRGPDLLVDFGRELYVPWQLASGKMLYLDVAQFIDE